MASDYLANRKARFLSMALTWTKTETGIEILAYNYAYGKDLQAFYLERADSRKDIGYSEAPASPATEEKP